VTLIMGTIMAATTGIVGASVIMLTLIALPTMLAQRLRQGALGRHHRVGGHARHPHSAQHHAGDHGRPDEVPVGTLFTGAIVPGLLMSRST
jgi:TRAP-type mannitol/chloroaromatic compound transport system permease large subunit